MLVPIPQSHLKREKEDIPARSLVVSRHPAFVTGLWKQHLKYGVNIDFLQGSWLSSFFPEIVENQAKSIQKTLKTLIVPIFQTSTRRMKWLEKSEALQLSWRMPVKNMWCYVRYAIRRRSVT